MSVSVLYSCALYIESTFSLLKNHLLPPLRMHGLIGCYKAREVSVTCLKLHSIANMRFLCTLNDRF